MRIAEGAALMTETELSVDFKGACSGLLPNDILEGVLHRHVERLGAIPFDEDDQATARQFQCALAPAEIETDRVGVGLVPDDTQARHDGVPPLNQGLPRLPPMGSTDVGDVSWVTPTRESHVTCFALGTPFHTWQMVAQGKLAAAHKGMVHDAKAVAATAVELFTDAALLARARDEFEQSTARTPYQCPIPDGVLAPPNRAERF